ncbi:hypothetical protein NPIL_141951 [Nephila pilipes]|uniref:Uncharacterized protein n=1 Tax=Nephila pilipes TaxID=299642 RepID=A0A8X6MCS0_NEPPI|nr:hypothetical protein NPIL_141951 [Nephila pilipes]
MEKLVQLRGTYCGCFTKFSDKLDTFLKTEESKEIMPSAKFDLRGYKYNEGPSTFHRPNVESSLHEDIGSVLGLEYNRQHIEMSSERR